jgi:hypothetical protein
MSNPQVRVRELAGWGLDDYEYRPRASDIAKAIRLAGERSGWQQSSIIVENETSMLGDTLAMLATRPDLVSEMSGLAWSLGVIDLRPLVAFQRRLFLYTKFSQISVPPVGDWAGLLDLCLGAVAPLDFEILHNISTNTLVIRSSNPNLHLRTTNHKVFPLSLHTGGPFFEVASYRGRWFLRDGYHRAYALLKASVFHVPAVIVHANTLQELGANRPWFFGEQLLFADAPPLVTDFLNDGLVTEYNRPALIKTLRITMEETLTPLTVTGEES